MVADGAPPKLVACRGIPIAAGDYHSLGELPDVADIPVRTAGSGDAKPGRAHMTRVMQIASGAALMDYARRCDEASGGRLPVMFDAPVMAWALPRVAEDGRLVTLALVNASIDRQEPVGVRLRGIAPSVRSAMWITPEAPPVELPLVHDGEFAHTTLPRIGAWELGYLSPLTSQGIVKRR